MKKFLPLLLCLIMLVSVLAVTVSAARTEPNITVSIDKTEVSADDAIVVNIGIKDMKATSILFTLDFDPELLTLTSITAKRNAKIPYSAYDPDAEGRYEGSLLL